MLPFNNLDESHIGVHQPLLTIRYDDKSLSVVIGPHELSESLPTELGQNSWVAGKTRTVLAQVGPKVERSPPHPAAGLGDN